MHASGGSREEDRRGDVPNTTQQSDASFIPYLELCSQLTQLLKNATDVPTWCPRHAVRRLRALRAQTEPLRTPMETWATEFESSFNLPYATPAPAIQTIVLQPLHLGNLYRSNYLRLLWLEVSLTLDQKGAYALAWFALYVTTISGLASIVSLVLAFR